MEAKLSSVRVIAAASLVTSVPVIPIATPMAAFFSRGVVDAVARHRDDVPPLLDAGDHAQLVGRGDAGIDLDVVDLPGELLVGLCRWAARVELPQSYLDLLRTTNGVEGWLSKDAYLLLWPAEQVPDLNDAYSVAEFAPGLLLIGSDGADTGFALDTRRRPMSVQSVPLVGMSLAEAKTAGSDFENFLRQLKASRQ